MTAAAAANWDQTVARLRSAAAELGGPHQRFAVRSTATAEDLAGASYAGQYETVLEVGLDELADAVRRVFDSAASVRWPPTGRPTLQQTQPTRPGPAPGWRSWSR